VSARSGDTKRKLGPPAQSNRRSASCASRASLPPSESTAAPAPRSNCACCSISAISGEMTTPMPPEAMTGSWKTSDLPRPVGIRTSDDLPFQARPSQDGTVRLWDEGGREVAVLRGHTAEVRHVSYSPDGQRLASAGADGTVRLWDEAGKAV